MSPSTMATAWQCRRAVRIECGDNVMGIFDALTTAVSGLQSQSFALQNISGNIANASTIGYKGIDTTFEDLVASATTPSAQAAGGVQAFAQQTITTAGTVSSSTVATNMAINGDGFFSVQMPPSVVDNAPVFNGVTDYTRAGDFQVNANGYLVNGAGYYLMGTTVDPKTGNPTGSVPTVLNFSNNFVPAQATTAIQYAANLPTVPVTEASPTAASGSITAAGGLNPADFGANNPVVAGTPAVPFGDSSVTGAVALNQASPAAPITGSTLLTGASGTDSLTSPFTTSDTLTVNGKTIAFVTTGSTSTSSSGGVINLTTGTVQDVLDAVDKITGTFGTSKDSTVTGGQITFHTGTSGTSLSVGSTDASAFNAMGFATTATAAPTGGGSAGTGFVIGKDVRAFDNESISAGAIPVHN